MQSGNGDSLTTRIGTALSNPFGTNMTWVQLAAVIVFVFVVAAAWRQVTLFIADHA